MSKKPQYDPEELRYPDQHIVERSLVPEMEKSYIEYAMSVIVGRALPDVRDGLKPVHRPPAWATCWAGITPTATRPCTTPWCAWPRISPCAICWWTATATSAPWMAIPRRPTDTLRPGLPRSQAKCCGTSKRTPWTGTPTSTRAVRSPGCCPAGSPICWSTVPPALP